jgi:sensor histidine kinase regulating citrate/malate metabolism/HPt (histidine-containing phosphotransfer) domain-containing protein
MNGMSLLGRSQRLPLIATLVFAGLLAIVLAYGMRRATQLQAASSALQSASTLAPQPQLITSQLTLIQRGLESATYVGDALGSIHDFRKGATDALRSISSIVERAGLKGEASVSGPLTAVQDKWRRYDAALAGLENVRADALYVDTVGGSQLSEPGRALRARINDLLSNQERTATDLSAQLTSLASALQTAVADMGTELRLLLMAGTLLASLLIVLMLYFAMRARISSSAARQAARQVESILASVREGLFLVDRDGRIGKAHSASLANLLHTANPGGNTLQDLLQPMVDEKTRVAASKFLNLLWNKRVNEELIDSVNPLQQISVNVAGLGGEQEVRYLSFAFHRVQGAADYLLGSVADVTERVTLQQELDQLKASAASGGTGSDIITQLLRVDPAQLDSFINSAGRACENCNTRLKAPGKDEHALRDKLDAVFRELHAVKGEAAALGLDGLARRVHAAEEVLSALRGKVELAGNDFIPVVTHLDVLIRHIGELSTARAQLSRYSGRAVRQPDSPTASQSTASTQNLGTLPASDGNAIERLLRSLVAEVGKALDRDVQLHTEGLDKVPPEHHTRVKDICVQMVRNCLAHGIESAAERSAAGKPAGGNIKVSFTDNGRGEYALVIEDDGQGLSYDRILYRARQLSLVQPEQTVLDRGSVFKMIFMPGFSTVEDVNGHAGRGVGLDAVNSLVRECGGRIGIATIPGQFTRFRVLLPSAALQSTALQA